MWKALHFPKPFCLMAFENSCERQRHATSTKYKYVNCVVCVKGKKEEEGKPIAERVPQIMHFYTINGVTMRHYIPLKFHTCILCFALPVRI